MVESFGIFRDDQRGPLWVEFCEDLEQARAKAHRLADEQQAEYFVFSFEVCREVARFYPTAPKP